MSTQKRLTRAEASLIKCLGQPVNHPDSVVIETPKINFKPAITWVLTAVVVIVVLPVLFKFGTALISDMSLNSAYSQYAEIYEERIRLHREFASSAGNQWINMSPRGTSPNDSIIEKSRFESIEQIESVTNQERANLEQLKRSVAMFTEQQKQQETMLRETRINQWIQTTSAIERDTLGGMFLERLNGRLKDLEARMSKEEVAEAKDRLKNR